MTGIMPQPRLHVPLVTKDFNPYGLFNHTTKYLVFRFMNWHLYFPHDIFFKAAEPVQKLHKKIRMESGKGIYL